MKQYEPCIQNNNNNNNNNSIIIIIIKWKKNQKGERASGGERVGERDDLFYFFLSFLFSQIYENRTASFRRD